MCTHHVQTQRRYGEPLLQPCYLSRFTHPPRCQTWPTDPHTQGRLPHTEPERASRVYTQRGVRDKGSTSINAHANSFLHTYGPQWGPSPRCPAEHTCCDSTPWASHSAKAPRPRTQSVCPEHASQRTEALGTRTLPPWSDCALQPPPRTDAPLSLYLREGGKFTCQYDKRLNVTK